MIKIIVLGLLIRQPMHGYEIYDYLKVSQVDRWSDILPGSIYYALRTLNSEGHIKIKDSKLTGNRNKAIYVITESGKNEFINLLKKSWEEDLYSFPKKLYSLLAFSKYLPKGELRLMIEKQIKKYEAETFNWDIENINLDRKKIDFLSEVVFKNGRKHIEIDIELLKTILELIDQRQEEGVYEQ